MKILIQKFGGTSVVDEKARTAVKDKVQQAIRSGYAPVVVVSAIGRKGAPYATDTLIDFLKQVNLSVNVREQDMLMCCGEIISACIMAATLQKFAGHDGKPRQIYHAWTRRQRCYGGCTWCGA